MPAQRWIMHLDRDAFYAPVPDGSPDHHRSCAIRADAVLTIL